MPKFFKKTDLSEIKYIELEQKILQLRSWMHGYYENKKINIDCLRGDLRLLDEATIDPYDIIQQLQTIPNSIKRFMSMSSTNEIERMNLELKEIIYNKLNLSAARPVHPGKP
jgi:hypothetical protein